MKKAVDHQRLQQQFEFEVYPKRDVTFVRGEGCLVWDETGKEYLDCAAGHGVANVGHCNPAVVEAIREQAGKLITCPGTYYNDAKAQLLEKLASITPEGLNRSFLCNSGAEAIEAAIKFARATTGRKNFVCANRSFHGRTLGALSATFNHAYRDPFEPLLPGFTFSPYNNINALEQAVTNETAAVVLEPVLGEGGVYVGDHEYLQAARDRCTQTGALLIFDEIQTGFCRTGRMFASMHAGVIPDIMCVAKAIAGGLPMGAAICGERIEVSIGLHGSTFGGNPLCCAAANAAIDYMMAHQLDVKAASLGSDLMNRLRERNLSKVREIRGVGLMIGVELRSKARPIVMQLLEEGIITLPTGATVIRLLPPLTITPNQINQLSERLLSHLH
jgi:acetylornithine/LysW-gamma-L-lysine aminotransferase